MRQRSLRKTFASLMLASILLLFILLYLISGYEDTVVEYNSYVSMTISIENNINDIEKVYYQSFLEDEYILDERQKIEETLATIDGNFDRSVERGILDSKVDSVNFMTLEEHYQDLKEWLLTDQAYLETSVSQTQMLIEKAKMQSTNLKQEIIVIIRAINQQASFLNTLMVVYDIIVLIAIFFIVERQLIAPLKKFSATIKDRIDKNVVSPPPIEMTTKHELGIFVENLNRYIGQLSVITELNTKIFSQKDFDEVVDFIFDACHTFIPYNRLGIAIISEDGKYIKALRAKADYPLILNRNYQEPLSKSSIAEVIKRKEIRILNDLEAYYRQHPKSESTRIILSEGIRSSMTVPLLIDQQVIGVIFFSSDKANAYDEAHKEFVYSITNAIAIAFEKSFVFDDLILASVKGFAKIVESKDHVTGNHIDRMSIYSKFIAESLYKDSLFIKTVDDAYIDQIYKFSPLHDIGKVGISEAILNKPAKLSVEEFDNIKTHTLIGYNVLANMTTGAYLNKGDYFKIAGEITKSHHEKFDGSGYPEGLSGEQIPLSARVVAVADVFDALTNVRPYKKAYSFEEAWELLIKGKGNHFDPVIIECLERHIDAFKSLYEVLKLESDL